MLLSNRDSQSEASTQTTEKTNINIISNVRLSQTTLNTILKKVMQDMVVLSPNFDKKRNQRMITAKDDVKPVQASKNDVINETKPLRTFSSGNNEVIKVKEEVSSTASGNKIVKYTVGNVTSAKTREPNDKQHVYRDTFFQRTSSLEVNTSSANDSDESDSNSLVDSLEGSPRPKRVDLNKYERPVKGEMYFLTPDTPNKRKSPSAFFVPMQNDATDDTKPIADHFPPKLKEKLAQRKAQRDLNTEYRIVAKDAYLLEARKQKQQPKRQSDTKLTSTKSVLPSIGFNKGCRQCKKDKAIQCKPVYKNLPPMSGSYNYRGQKTLNKFDEKTIRILEIMECVETAEKRSRESARRFRSKIPRLVRPYKLPKISLIEKQKKVDYTKVQTDPKIDRLIANILINTIHTDCVANVQNMTFNSFKRPYTVPTFNANAYGNQQSAFQVIPENSINSGEDVTTHKFTQTDLKSIEDAVSVPQGWITFYSQRKDQFTSDSGSDDGTNIKQA